MEMAAGQSNKQDCTGKGNTVQTYAHQNRSFEYQSDNRTSFKNRQAKYSRHMW